MSPAVPTYELYGESDDNHRELQLHCETIAARSRTYRWEIDLHRHEKLLQFLYIRSGSGDALLDDAVVTLAPPCVIVVPPGPAHGFRFSSDVDGVVITIAARHPRLGQPAADVRILTLDPSADETTYLDATFRRIAAEYDAARPGREALLEAYVATLAILFDRGGPSTSDPIPLAVAQRHVEALKELVGRHFRQQMTAEAYARRLGMSSTHLNRVVRQVTGMTTHDLIVGRSMEEARRALTLTDASIGHIAESLGFSDAAYFSRFFKLRAGQSPRDYRHSHRTAREIDRGY